MTAKACPRGTKRMGGRCVPKTKKKFAVVAVTVDINEAGNYYPIIDENVKLKPKIFTEWNKAVDYSDKLFEKGMATDTLVIPIGD